VETLVEELSSPDDARVLYAIDMLEALDRRRLITPLLLHHASARVRARALRAADLSRGDAAEHWAAAVERMLRDEDGEARAAAVNALATLRGEDAGQLMRRYLADPDPRIVANAAVVLSGSSRADDVEAAMAALAGLGGDLRPAAAANRREAAAALGRVRRPDFRPLLVPLMGDEDLSVAAEAIRSVRDLGAADPLFVPGLVARLGHRTLKPAARDALIAGGESVLDALALFLADADENLWVRRHIPETIARIPSQRAMNVLLAALGDRDGFLRYKVIAALERLRRDHPGLAFDRAPAEALLLTETRRYYEYLTLRHNLISRDAVAAASLLVRALGDKLERTLDRIFRLLGLVYSIGDIAAVRRALAGRDARTRAGALEYMDHLLSGQVRRRVMPILEDQTPEEKVRHAHAVMGSRPRDVEDTLVHLIHDEDPVVAASAIHFAESRGGGALRVDLEYIVQHRHTADRHVFEAAWWALAGGRAGERRWDEWRHALPVVELASRLRAIPLFDFVSVDELFRIAGAARQVRHEQGREIYREGVRPGRVEFLLDGSVSIGAAGGARRIDAPAALAFEEVLEDTPLAHAIRADGPVTGLGVTQHELLTMLSDNIELAQGLFRMLLDRASVRHWLVVHRPPPGPAGGAAGRTGAPLTPIDKALLLGAHPLFARALVHQLLGLASIAREVPLAAGAALVRETDDPAVIHVLDGEVRLESDSGEPIVAGRGCTIGLVETLAGVPLGRRAQVTRAGAALRLGHEELFDLLEDNIDLLQAIFSGLSRASGPASMGTGTADARLA